MLTPRGTGAARLTGAALVMLAAIVAGGTAAITAAQPAGATAPAGTDTYGTTLARAAALDAAGAPAQAEASLAAIEDVYPDDFTLHLRLGYLRFRLGRYPEALRSYRRASALSQGQREAELGLGFTLLRMERYAAACGHFRAVLAASPDDPDALEGQRLCDAAQPRRLRVHGKLVGHAYAGHPVLTDALALQAGADGRPLERLHFSAVYRGAVFRQRATLAGDGAGRLAPIIQHEFYAAAGLWTKRIGGDLHYARVASDASFLSTADVAGLSLWARPAPWLAGDVEASASRYDDLTVARIQPAVFFGLGEHFGARPAFALQWLDGEDGEIRWAAELQLSAQFAPVTAWVGGRLGQQRRPTFLAQPTVYNTDDVIGAGAWAAIELAVANGWLLGLTYEMQQRVSSATLDGSSVDAGAHFVVLAFRFER